MKHLFKTFTMVLIVLLVLVGLALSTTALGQTRPSNEERLIRVEEGVKNLDKRFDDMNKRIDELETSLNKRIDELREFLLWGFGVMFAGMFALIGFVIWDRRTALAPVAKQTRDLYANQEKILAALREHAKHDEKLMEFMKRAGLW